MKITSNDLQRFSKQIILKEVGIIGQKKISSARVLIIGAGGLGCPLMLYLANTGIGNIGIVDNDKINISKTFRSPLSAETLFPGLKMDLMHLLLSPTPSFAHMGAKACFPCRRNPRGLQRAEPGTIYILAIGLMRLMYSTNLPAQ